VKQNTKENSNPISLPAKNSLIALEAPMV